MALKIRVEHGSFDHEREAQRRIQKVMRHMYGMPPIPHVTSAHERTYCRNCDQPCGWAPLQASGNPLCDDCRKEK